MSCFRPISLLDVVGKICERLISEKVNLHIVRKVGFSGNQYGFTEEKSTIEMTETVVELVKTA